MANKRDAELHKGHRQRLKERAMTYGINSLSDHEKLELLLMYVIPRRDLNELAHTLINTFGSYNNVFDADISDLMKVKGIGKESSMLIKFMPEFYQVYANGKYKGKSKMETSKQCVEYFRECFDIEDTENAYISLFNSRYELIKTISIAKYKREREVEIDEILIQKETENSMVKYVVIFHTHPYSVIPSVEDLMNTVRIMMRSAKTVRVVDHIILNKKDYYSFKDSTIIEELRAIANDRLNMLKVGNPKTYRDILNMIEKDSEK